MARSKDPRIVIVKVQRPLFSTDPNVGFLVYAKGRRNMVEQSIRRDTRVALGDAPKAYFKAIWIESVQAWNIGERVPDQSW